MRLKHVACKINMEMVYVSVPEMDTGDLYVNHALGLMEFIQHLYVQDMVLVQLPM